MSKRYRITLAASSVLMACVAVHAVVHVAIHILVMEVGCVVAAVATGAGKYGVIGRVGMAVRADAVGVAVVGGEEGVIAARQSGRCPIGGGVAGGAGGWPARRGVIRIGGPGEVRLMAGIAIGGRTGKHVIDVACRASYGGVSTREREGSVVVVEGRARP